MIELLYNRKHKHGWSVMENAFDILKQNFWEF